MGLMAPRLQRLERRQRLVRRMAARGILVLDLPGLFLSDWFILLVFFLLQVFFYYFIIVLFLSTVRMVWNWE
jgi:hypothetical protein